MSKTHRNIPTWAKIVPDADLEKYEPRSRRRMERFNRRIRTQKDGAFSSVLGSAQTNTPQGFNTWDEVWGTHRKRKEKARTSRMRRRNAEIDVTGYEDTVDV